LPEKPALERIYILDNIYNTTKLCYSLGDHLLAGGLHAIDAGTFQRIVGLSIHLDILHAAQEGIVGSRSFGGARGETCCKNE